MSENKPHHWRAENPDDWINDPCGLYEHLGTFHVALDALSFAAESISTLFNGLIVLKVEHDFTRQALRYTAAAPFFDRIPKHGVPSHYTPVITMHPLGTVPRYTVNWRADR